jgi:uncharacterized protein YbjT (DUF2867 family)
MTQDQPLILVTGATGLVGAEVVRRLSARGVRVRALVRNAVTTNASKAAELTLLAIDDIAEVAAEVLTGSGHEGRIYPITGPESLGMAEVAAKLSAATGLAIRYVDVSPEDFIAARLAAGAPAYAAEGLGELFAERRKGKEATVYPTLETVFGRRPTSFVGFARRYAAVFRGEVPAPRV